MARTQKKDTPPINNTCEIKVSTALTPLTKAFHVDLEEDGHVLIKEAAKALDAFSKRDLSKEELEEIMSLMKGLNPHDSLETLYAAQIIASHMLGMRKLSADYSEDQKLGLKLLRFSNEAMQQLNRKRSGGANITVNTTIKEINHADSGN